MYYCGRRGAAVYISYSRHVAASVGGGPPASTCAYVNCSWPALSAVSACAVLRVACSTAPLANPAVTCMNERPVG